MLMMYVKEKPLVRIAAIAGGAIGLLATPLFIPYAMHCAEEDRRDMFERGVERNDQYWLDRAGNMNIAKETMVTTYGWILCCSSFINDGIRVTS